MRIPIEQIQYEDKSSTFQENDLIEFKKTISELAQSIQIHGLINPITVQNGPSYSIGLPNIELVTGLKRLLACKELGLKEIEADIQETRDQQGKLEYHLHENLRRYNIPWYEQVELEKQLHEVYIGIHGGFKRGRPKTGQTGWSMEDTAKELGIAFGTLSEDIKLADEVRTDPSLKKVKDKTTARRLVRQMVKRRTAEAESLLDTAFEMDQVYLGDSLEVLKRFPSASFSACITDPPWLNYRDESLTKDESTPLVFKEVFRVLKYDSFLLAVVSTDDFIFYREELPKFGFSVQTYPLIWYKPGVITHGRRQWEYARDFEPILVAVKGNPSLTSSTQMSAVIEFKPIHSTLLTHPHEKPVGLLERLVKNVTYEGGSVLDPFAGSGSTLKACKSLSRPYMGIERNKTFYDKIAGALK